MLSHEASLSLYSNLQGKIGPGGQIRVQIRRMVADMFSGQGGQAKTLASWLMRMVCEALTSRQACRQTDLAQPAIALIAYALRAGHAYNDLCFNLSKLAFICNVYSDGWHGQASQLVYPHLQLGLPQYAVLQQRMSRVPARMPQEGPEMNRL